MVVMVADGCWIVWTGICREATAMAVEETESKVVGDICTGVRRRKQQGNAQESVVLICRY